MIRKRIPACKIKTCKVKIKSAVRRYWSMCKQQHPFFRQLVDCLAYFLNILPVMGDTYDRAAKVGKHLPDHRIGQRRKVAGSKRFPS